MGLLLPYKTITSTPGAKEVGAGRKLRRCEFVKRTRTVRLREEKRCSTFSGRRGAVPYETDKILAHPPPYGMTELFIVGEGFPLPFREIPKPHIAGGASPSPTKQQKIPRPSPAVWDDGILYCRGGACKHFNIPLRAGIEYAILKPKAFPFKYIVEKHKEANSEHREQKCDAQRYSCDAENSQNIGNRSTCICVSHYASVTNDCLRCIFGTQSSQT